MVTLKSKEEVETMAEGGKRLARVLAAVASRVKQGIKTAELDEAAFDLIKKEGCAPAFLGYTPGGAAKPYPATLCVSVNECVVHGIPSQYKVRDGDIVKLDLGLIFEGLYLDSAVSIGVGSVVPQAMSLLAAAEEALRRGIEKARVGNTLGDIGWAIQQCVEGAGFAVADLLTGHGIGRRLHEDPYVYNKGERGEGMALVEGMVIAIEPMVAAGSGRVKQLADDSFATADGSLSAHFEHTVAITKEGPRVLTAIAERMKN
jgi:methionyl aminopeptidase